MSRKIVLTSYTPLDSGGGVPRWNRDFISGFPGTVHYSWWDVAPVLRVDPSYQSIPEWEKAQVLNRWLLSTKRVTEDDIVISDSFWSQGLEHLPGCVSHQHGNWSHTTKDDFDRGVQPEFPAHAAVQLDFRKKYITAGRKLTAVSDFISTQMKLQWGFDSTVVNNGIDLDLFKPVPKMSNWTDKRLVIHGVTTTNKGFEHIQAIKECLPDDWVMSLDEAADFLEIPKYEALANADLVVHPSAHEGNSYFLLESLACDVPVVCYNIGLAYSIDKIANNAGIECQIGCVIDRKYRSPEETAKVTKFILESVCRDRNSYNPRQIASLFSIKRFHSEWRNYLESLEKTFA